MKLMQGQTDTPLNPNGIVQAQAAADLLAKRRIATICHSPLRRAKHTAELIAEKAAAANVVSVEGLMECNFGVYEGHPAGPWHREWLQGASIPEGETRAQFLQRSKDAVNLCLAYSGPVLIVAHGGTFSAIQIYLNDPQTTKAGNCQLLALSPPRKDAKLWTAKHIVTPEVVDAEEPLMVGI